ncbi:MAG: hypothetical protein ABEK00_01920 [Candidatus Nanohaloarchaea archaeon]
MLFDNRGDSNSDRGEEVSISPSSGSGSGKETEIRRDRGSEESDSGGGISIPSAEGDGSAVDESKVTLEDIHRQNKKIIGLLEDIADEESGTENDNSDRLKGDVENELL